MDVTLAGAALFVVAAVLVGFAKTAIGGVASISIAIFAGLMPARESTAAILLLLIIGDVVAVSQYRHDCDWSLLRQLIPAVLPGLVLGAAVLAVIDDSMLRRGIGVLIIVLALLQLALRGRNPDQLAWTHSHGASAATGLAAGFTTMTANAAGAVMTLYLVARGVEKRRFIGTGAWFFLGVNLCKLPFSTALGLFTTSAFALALALAPFVLLGCWVGIHTVRRINQAQFEVAVLSASVVSAVALLV
jgi:uncharacterized membrane protein YfcA